MKYLFTCIAILFTTAGFCQGDKFNTSHPKKTMIEFNGGKYSGYEVEMNASKDIVEEAIKQKFKSLGTKPKETKGFMVFRNVNLGQENEGKALDAYFKVESKSKKEKAQSIVYFMAAPTGEIPEDKLKSGDVAATTIDNGDAFLLGLVPAITFGAFEKDLSTQELMVKKEEKALAKLKDEQADLEKKIAKLQNDLEYNVKAQEKQTLQVDNMKTKLSELISKKPLKEN
jgi:hypothetical protein